MTNAWRVAGLTYINYSNIAGQLVRKALKVEMRAEAAKRDQAHIRLNPWVNGVSTRKATAETSS